MPVYQVAAFRSVLAGGLSLILVGVVIWGAWWALSQFTKLLPNIISPPPIAMALVAVPKPPTPALAPMNAAAIQEAEQKRLEAGRAWAAQHAADALAKRKQTAWNQYYKPPASCEHPPAWQDQVECGNRYIRAKREFEKLWSNQVNSQPAPVNPDSSIVIGGSQSKSSPTGSASTAK